MRHVILLDNKIKTREYNNWVKEDTAFWQEHIGVTPEYNLIKVDYSDYPTYIDNDGDVRPTKEYLQSLNDQATAKYGPWGFDFAMVMIHEDNWKSPTIWGTNYSYIYGSQCLDYCRWDRDNSANTFGTAYHERHHSFDAICKVEVGIDVRPLLSVGAYDREVTHGNSPKWAYIRHKENTKSLETMAPHLRASFSKRNQRHSDRLEKKTLIIDLLTEVAYLLKLLINKKNGVPKG